MTVYAQDEPPTVTNAGDIWIDTGTNNPYTTRYSGPKINFPDGWSTHDRGEAFMHINQTQRVIDTYQRQLQSLSFAYINYDDGYPCDEGDAYISDKSSYEVIQSRCRFLHLQVVEMKDIMHAYDLKVGA